MMRNFKNCIAAPLLVAALCGLSMQGLPLAASNVPSAMDAQQNRITVQGIVTDSSNEPVIGASIIVKGTTNGTVTDINGHYSLTVPQDAILEVSSIGYTSIEAPLNGRSTINFVLEVSSEQLSGVVVTAMGIVRNTRTLSYATQSIRGDDLTIARSNSGNLLDDLKGRLSGADITTTSQVGGSSRIVLRGVKSVNGGANAMFVVDGVPIMNPSTGDPGNEWQSYMGSDGIIDLNADDIKSIDIMKGPSAAALYGSSAANGAVIITTKSGAKGRSSVRYNGSISLDTPVYLLKMQNKYGRGNGGIYSEDAGESWGAEAKCVKDNFKEPFKNGYTANNSFSFDAGNDLVQGYMSYTNSHTLGNIDNNFMNKHTFDLRVSTSIIKNLTTDGKITYVKSKINNMPTIGDTGLGVDAYIMPRDLTIDELKDYEDIDEGSGQPIRKYWTTSSVFDNPLWVIHRTRQNQYRDRILAMGSVKYQILPWLSIQGRYSFDSYKNKTTRLAYNGTHTWSGTVNPGGYYGEWNDDNSSENIDVLLSGENSFLKDFKVTYNIGATRIQGKWNNIGITANGLSKANQFHASFATSPVPSYGRGSSELQAVYGAAQLSWKDALYLDVTGRNDWSSTLPSPYDYFYPSVGLTSILSDLIAMPEWISFSKVRGSWAKVGAGAGAYMLQETYSYDSTRGWTNLSSTKMNSDLKPEMTTSWEIGTEWKFLNDRLGIDFTYYDSRTKNQLIVIATPWSSGYDYSYINCGRVDNKGIELTLNATPVQTKDWSWDTRVNLSHNKNKLAELYEGVNEYQIGGSDKFATVWSIKGKQIGELNGQTWAKNDEGKYLVDKEGLPVLTDSRQDLGNYNPKLTFGWSNTVSYKRFSLNILIDGKIGGVMMSGTDAVLAYYGVGDFTQAHRNGDWVLDAVTESGAQNTVAISSEQFWKKVSGGRYGSGGFFTFDATNVRLRQLSLSYDIPLGRQNLVKGARVSLTGRNLFFFYRGKNKLHIPGLDDRKIPIDPDQAMGAGSYQGAELGLLPSTRSFGLNVNLTF